MLRDAGVVVWEGEAVDQDLVAVRAGTVLPAFGGPEADVPPGASVPPGAESWADYRFELPLADPGTAGTAPAGLAAAIEECSGGALACVPVQADAWSPETVEALVARAGALDARLIANIRSGLLWGSRPPAAVLMAELDGGGGAEPPPADWDVGHFVEPVGVLRGRAGALVLVRDSYPSLGWDGHYLQPPRALAAALDRGDGRRGGILVIVPSDRRADVVQVAAELALETRMWDNGTRR